MGLFSRHTTWRQYWTPARGSGALHWWRADLGASFIGVRVSQLNDQVGTAHMVQATDASRPTVAVSANYSNKKVLVMSTSFLSVVTSAKTRPLTILIVGHTTANTRSLFASSDTGLPMFWRNGSGALEFFTNSPVPTTRLASPNSTATSAAAWLFTDDGLNTAGSMRLYKNALSTNVGTITIGNDESRWPSVTNLGIGQGAAGVPACLGEIAEVAMWSGVMNAANKANLSMYLNARYPNLATTP